MTLGASGGAVKPLARAEILALPPAISLADLGRALRVSEPVIRAQHRSGELERLGIRVVRLGAQHRVVTADLWRFLGIGPDGQAGGTDSEVPPRAGARRRGPASSALRLASGQSAPD
jgi:hypothetical protein